MFPRRSSFWENVAVNSHYSPPVEDIDETFEFLGECTGDWTCRLIREDGNAKYEARTWMAKTRAEACFDGPPVAPKKGIDERSVGVFTNLVPGAQYRLEIVREPHPHPLRSGCSFPHTRRSSSLPRALPS